jgi:hypothetical protein
MQLMRLGKATLLTFILILLLGMDPDRAWSNSVEGGSSSNQTEDTEGANSSEVRPFSLIDYWLKHVWPNREYEEFDKAESSGILDLAGKSSLSQSLNHSEPFQTTSTNSEAFVSTITSFGGSSVELLANVLATADGGFLATGVTASSDGDLTGLSPLSPTGVGLMLKYDSNQNLEWKRTKTNAVASFAQTSDGDYIGSGSRVGTQNEADASLIRYDANWNELWHMAIGGSGDEILSSVVQTSDGGFIAAGYTLSNDRDFSGLNKGGRDAFIVKFTANGSITWIKTFGGTGNEEFTNVAPTSDGGAVVVGLTSSENTMFPNAINPFNALIMKYDTDGEVVWKKVVQGDSYDTFNSIQRIYSGGYIVAGSSVSSSGDYAYNFGSEDAILARFDENGNTLWIKNIGGQSVERFLSVQKLSDGGFVAVGNSNSNDGHLAGINKGGLDGIIAKFDADGNLLRIETTGGSSNDYLVSVASAGNGKYVAVGDTKSSNGDLAGQGKGNRDGLIAVYQLLQFTDEGISFAADKTEPTNSDVMVTIDYPTSAAEKQYKLGRNGAWTSYVGPIVLSENTTIFARKTDGYGNMSPEFTFPVTNIDKMGPSGFWFIPSITSPTNQNVMITIIYQLNEPLLSKEYRINGGDWIEEGLGQVTMTENGTVELRLTDLAGNFSLRSYTVDNIDKVAEDPTFNLSTTAVTNQNIFLNIYYPYDAVTREYRLNDGPWMSLNNIYTPIVISENLTVSARHTDAVGNESNIASYQITNIDKTPPAAAGFTADITEPTRMNVSVTIIYPEDATRREYSYSPYSFSTEYSGPITVYSNDVIYARSKDLAGNISEISSYAVTNIDRVPPAIPTLVADVTTPTNRDVAVTITYPVDAYLKEHRVNGGAWEMYRLPVVLGSNGTVEARATDQAGNVSTVSGYTVTNIDKVPPVPPVIQADPTTMTTGNVGITVLYPADAATKEYRVNGGEWTAYQNPLSFEWNGTVEARATDEAGNQSTASYTIANIDKTPPTAPFITLSHTEWSNENVAVEIAAGEDPESGIQRTEYRSGIGGWTTYTGPFQIAAEGITTVAARTFNNLGVVGSETQIQVKIDRIAPPAPVWTITPNGWTNGPVTLFTSSGTDSGSGLDRTEYRIGSAGNWTTVLPDNGYPWSEGITDVYARNIDKAGNSSYEASIQVKVDKTAPTVPTFSPVPSGWGNQDVTVAITSGYDAVSGLGRTEYKLEGISDWTLYTSPFIISREGITTIHARSIDLASNASGIVSSQVHIDKAPPLAPKVIISSSGANVSVSVISGYDAGGIMRSEYRIGSTGNWVAYSTPFEIPDTANDMIFARSIDFAGNTSPEGVVMPKTNITYSYDSKKLTSILLPSGRSMIYEYNLNGDLLRVYLQD